jgi:regulator of replication initiation timing
MFKLKKRKNPAISNVVEQIHQDFDSAEERLLKEAQSIIDQEANLQLANGDLAKRLGFENSKPSREANEAQAKLEEMKKLRETIAYFREKYPLYKFITMEEVTRICEKWNLVLGDARDYTGDIPEKNLKNMGKFILKEDDWDEVGGNSSGTNSAFDGLGNALARAFSEMRQPTIRINRTEMFSVWDAVPDSANIEIEGRLSMAGLIELERQWPYRSIRQKVKPPFLIAAPLHDFNQEGKVVEKGVLKPTPDRFRGIMDLIKGKESSSQEAFRQWLIDDPIVLQPVRGGCLIVDKWGPEASDPALVNEINN